MFQFTMTLGFTLGSFVVPDVGLKTAFIGLGILIVSVGCFMFLRAKKSAPATSKPVAPPAKTKVELSVGQRKIDWIESHSFWLAEESAELSKRAQWYQENTAAITEDHTWLLDEIKWVVQHSELIAANAVLTKDVQWLLEEPAVQYSRKSLYEV
jgi:hypothetical protein